MFSLWIESRELFGLIKGMYSSKAVVPEAVVVAFVLVGYIYNSSRGVCVIKEDCRTSLGSQRMRMASICADHN